MKKPRTHSEWNDYLESRGLDLLELTSGKGLSSTKLTIRCRSCGEVIEGVSGRTIFRRMNLCPICSGRFEYTTDSIRKIIVENGGIFIAGDVVNRDSQVRYNCPRCQRETTKKAQDVYRSPGGCRSCRGELISSVKLTNSDNLSRAQQLALDRSGRCLTTEGPVGTADKLLWECSLGHQWEANLNSVLHQETWCPACAGSRDERTVRAIFEAAYGVDFLQIRPDFLKESQMHLDGYAEELSLAFEVHGSQHYKRSGQFHRCDEDFTRQQERDRKKATLCQEHGVELIIVPHWEVDLGIKALQQYLSSVLMTCPVPPRLDPQTVDIDPKMIFDKTTDAGFKAFEHIVTERGGHFDPKDYLGRTTKITITCEQGHTWDALPFIIINGYWCPDCVGVSRLKESYLIEQLAQAGWSLDEDHADYNNAHQVLSLRCPNKHLVKRTWNAWQQQYAKGNVSCIECNRYANALEFVDKMLGRGFKVDVDLSEYQGEGQNVRGICKECSTETVLPVEKWKHRSLAPCCSRSLPAYHRCHE